jgi:hypothetical protein
MRVTGMRITRGNQDILDATSINCRRRARHGRVSAGVAPGAAGIGESAVLRRPHRGCPTIVSRADIRQAFSARSTDVVRALRDVEAASRSSSSRKGSRWTT